MEGNRVAQQSAAGNRPRSIRLAAALGLILVAVVSCSRPTHTPRDAQLRDGNGGDDWAAFGRTYGEQHYSPLTQIDAGNVARLGLAWSHDLPPGNSVTGPI